MLNYFIGYFLVVCRIGIAFASMPALSGPRYPMMVRMLLALAVSAAIAPFVVKPDGASLSPENSDVVWKVLSEVVVGFVFGFWGYCYIHAARFAGAFIVNAIGLSGIPGTPVDDPESGGQVTGLISMGFTALVFATDLHFVTIQALIGSYDTIPLGQFLDMQWAMPRMLQILSRSSVVALQMASPFIVLSIVINLGLGIANKMTPQLSVYFAFTGLVTFVSLVVLAIVSPTILLLAVDAYREFITSGFI
nr:flagellar biosynthetic protein FliR [Aestuariivirga litoralis]